MIRADTLNGQTSRVWDTTAGTVTEFDPPGSPSGVTRPMTPAEVAEFAAIEATDGANANESTLQARLRAFRTRNNEFLALATPTAAQRNAQVARLTREANALIRLALRDLANIDDASGAADPVA